jgi:hypothetical protein
MSTGTSTSAPITAANAAPLWMPNVATATARSSAVTASPLALWKDSSLLATRFVRCADFGRRARAS